MLKDEVWRVLEVSGFMDSYQDRIYLTVEDAVNAISIDEKLQNVSDIKVNIYVGQVYKCTMLGEKGGYGLCEKYRLMTSCAVRAG